MTKLIGVLLSSLALVCLSSCTKSPYGIHGLTLPPGSTIVEHTYSPVMYKGKAHPDYVGVRLIYFDNNDGWDTVVRHVDSRMKSAGYTEALDNPAFTDGARAEGIHRAKAMVRMYEGPVGSFSVTLTNEFEWGIDENPPAQFILRIQEAK